MKVDVLIVGQGLAGSTLAYELLQRGKSVCVLANETLPTSSGVAGGMFNPVTGKHLAKTWLADELFPYLLTYYTAAEEHLGGKFLHETGIYRPFANVQQQAHFLQLLHKHDLDLYINVLEVNVYPTETIENGLGGLLTKAAGWLDVPKFLANIKQYLLQHASYMAEPFAYDRLEIANDKIRYKEVEAEFIVFCEGFYVKNNPFFSWLPMNPVKGETLILQIPSYHIEPIVNQGVWLLPMQQQQVRLGATYSWHDLDFLPTAEARETLTTKVAKFLKLPYQIEQQQAGVRPATQDRRPIVGFHPQHRRMAVFNGLGTKGVSLAPYFAKKLAEQLFQNKENITEWGIERFYPLYLN